MGPDDNVPAVVYLLGVLLQLLPLLVLTSFAPALLAGCFSFLTSKGTASTALLSGLLGFLVAFVTISAAMGAGAYQIGWSPSPRSDSDVVQFTLLQFCAHSVVFWLVAAWIVASLWAVSRLGATLLAAGIIAGELTLLLADTFGLAALRPQAALLHAIVYAVLVFVVVRFRSKRSPGHASTSN